MDDCIFCRIINGDIPSYTIYEDELVKVISDISPANEGHSIIIAKNHCENIYDLDEQTAAHIFPVAQKIAKAVNTAFKPDGMNIVQNNGTVAGQSVFHFHTHVIPRYHNDNVQFKYAHIEVASEKFQQIMSEIKEQL